MITCLTQHKINELANLLTGLGESFHRVGQLLPEIQSELHSAELSEPCDETSQKNAHESQPSLPSGTPFDRMNHPIASLKLAKGWEEKLSAAGVVTVQDLGRFINDGKLVPGCFSRVGPEAVEKIKAAWREYVYPDGVTCEIAARDKATSPSTGPSLPPTAVAAMVPPTQSDESIRSEGAQFAAGGYKACENPHKPGTREHGVWDAGWQEYFATHEASDEATSEEAGESACVAEISEPVAAVADDEFAGL